MRNECVINFNHDIQAIAMEAKVSGIWLCISQTRSLQVCIDMGTWNHAVSNKKPRTVVPAAGYIKIQDYVSFANWVGNSYSDPWLRGVLYYMLCMSM